MALKDRFRRAVTRSSATTRSNSSSSSTPSSPTSPLSPSLTKTTSRLSKKLTWRSNTTKAEEKKEKWDEEKAYKGVGGKHHEILRGFEWKWRSSMDGGADGRRSLSLFGGISPGQSRVGSVDDTHVASRVGRRRSSAGSGVAGLERVRSGGKDVETVIEE